MQQKTRNHLVTAILSTLQMVNAGLAGKIHDPLISLLACAILAGVQQFVTLEANNTFPYESNDRFNQVLEKEKANGKAAGQ